MNVIDAAAAPAQSEFAGLAELLPKVATDDGTVIITSVNEAFARPNSLLDLFRESFRAGEGIEHLLDHVLVAAAHSPTDLLSLLSRAQRLLAHPGRSPHRLPIRLIILDSIASLFRADFDASPADLKRRSALFFQISAKLKELAYRHHCVVVVTNQVVDVVEGDAGNTVAWSSGRRVSPALGIAWANCFNTRLFLTREVDGASGTERRRMNVAFAPHLPELACEFVIRRDGVFGVEPAGEVGAPVLG